VISKGFGLLEMFTFNLLTFLCFRLLRRIVVKEFIFVSYYKGAFKLMFNLKGVSVQCHSVVELAKEARYWTSFKFGLFFIIKGRNKEVFYLTGKAAATLTVCRLMVIVVFRSHHISISYPFFSTGSRVIRR
jgi:hypothetical protein